MVGSNASNNVVLCAKIYACRSPLSRTRSLSLVLRTMAWYIIVNAILSSILWLGIFFSALLFSVFRMPLSKQSQVAFYCVRTCKLSTCHLLHTFLHHMNTYIWQRMAHSGRIHFEHATTIMSPGTYEQHPKTEDSSFIYNSLLTFTDRRLFSLFIHSFKRLFDFQFVIF